MTHLSKDKPIPRIDFGPLPPNLNVRETADEETRRDLTKSYEQLLSDAHEEIFNQKRTMEANIAFANRRIAGVLVRSAKSMDKAAEESIVLQTEIKELTRNAETIHRDILCYTKTLVGLTIFLAFLTLVLAFQTGFLIRAENSLDKARVEEKANSNEGAKNGTDDTVAEPNVAPPNR